MKPRPGVSTPEDLARWDALRRVAIVGAGTLKGKELKDTLDERKFPAVDVKLLDDDESLGQLDAVGDEPTFIQSVRPEHFEHVDFAFFASDAEFTRRTWRLARDAGCVVVDMSYGLEDELGAAVRAPWLEAELGKRGDTSAGIQVAAHPAATVLALLLHRARRAGPINNAVATLFEPASEQGRRGMDELHQQTVNLLSFQELPKAVFDAQVAFNLLSRYGADAGHSLETVEQRILRHFQAIGGRSAEGVPVPSVMLLHGPTFHAHAFSVYIQFAAAHSVGDCAQALAGEHITLARMADDAPSNVSAAGQNDVLVAVRRDVHDERAFWLWAAADNLKLAALTAVECAESSTAAVPKKRIQ
jgi:aspartate-semialdehyde dehydrogenase